MWTVERYENGFMERDKTWKWALIHRDETIVARFYYKSDATRIANKLNEINYTPIVTGR